MTSRLFSGRRLGILLFLVAGTARLGGNHYLMGYENMALFTAGIGLMVLAYLAKLYQLSTC